MAGEFTSEMQTDSAGCSGNKSEFMLPESLDLLVLAVPSIKEQGVG